MPEPKTKTGPLTHADLMEVWRSVTDPGYSGPLIEHGDGFGLEVPGQLAAQLARVSLAIDRTTQSLFILPWSGQTDEPASGERRSTVDVVVERGGGFETVITFQRGVRFAEVQIDMAEEPGGVEVETGRRYAVVESVTLGPGETVAVVPCVAERPGRGYDNPQPGTIRRIVQPGAGAEGSGATVVPGSPSHLLHAVPVSDVPVPDHVGAYLRFTTGANAGRLYRVVGYERPQPTATPPTGGTLVLAGAVVIQVATFVGTFVVGEEVEESGSGARGRFLHATADRLVLERAVGTFTGAGTTLTGSASAAVATAEPTGLDSDGGVVAEVGTAAWRVLDWVSDLGFTAANEENPTGGRLGTLDELGAERGLPRASGEGDDLYRERIATLADVVSPNAVRRAGNRVLAPIGESACLREVGSTLLPGHYLDRDFYDYNWVARPQDRFRFLLSYLEFRAFFMVGVPRLNLGEFGLSYDAGPYIAYDATLANFFDGLPSASAALFRSVWQAIDKIRAGGVGFDLYVETVGCA